MTWPLFVLALALTAKVQTAGTRESFTYMIFNQRGGKQSLEDTRSYYRIHLSLTEKRWSRFSLSGFFMLKPYVHYYKLTVVVTKLKGDLLPKEFALAATVSERKRKPDVEWKTFRLNCRNFSQEPVVECREIKPFIGNRNQRIVVAEFGINDQNGIAALLNLEIHGPTVIAQFTIHCFGPGLGKEEREKKLAFIRDSSL